MRWGSSRCLADGVLGPPESRRRPGRCRLVYEPPPPGHPLRLPAQPAHRMIEQDLRALGVRPVPTGTSVWTGPWSVHRDRWWFPAPATFRPGRWDDDAPHRVPGHAWFPFGGGPRACRGAVHAGGGRARAGCPGAAVPPGRREPAGRGPARGLTLQPDRPVLATLRGPAGAPGA
ncbi:cytochrome P450 [Streptomyces sp. NPDC090021]|uniref:cytochrome P450 n=1 Tax=Streptomyces sp. NPDC090021 TaxID=3365919 RepID=UPI0037F36953